LAGILSLLIPVFGFGYLTYRSTLKDTGSSAAAWRDVGSIGVDVLIAFVVLMCAISAIKSVSSRRERTLRSRFPMALVLSSGIIPQLRQAAMNSLSVENDGYVLTKRSWYISLMAAPDGISMWNGWGEPREIGRWDWTDVLDIQASTFEELGRSSNGVAITIRHGEGSLELPFVIVGSGFGGLFPAKFARVTRWAAEMLVFRDRTATAN
jgi:hypothetical protein